MIWLATATAWLDQRHYKTLNLIDFILPAHRAIAAGLQQPPGAGAPRSFYVSSDISKNTYNRGLTRRIVDSMSRSPRGRCAHGVNATGSEAAI